TERQRTSLRGALANMRDACHRAGIGPHQLRAVQKELLDGTALIAGVLADPAGPYLLELLADPSWLEPKADPGQAVPPLQVEPRAPAVGHLLKAIKAVGRAEQVGPPTSAARPDERRTSRGRRLQRSI